MFEKIVVTLDGSKLAEVALPYAEEMAAKMGCDMVLLSVIDGQDISEHLRYLKYMKKVEEITKYHAMKYIEYGKGQDINISAVIREGNPADDIIQYTQSIGYPLIIMASHGRSGIGRWTVGSVADKVVRSTRYQPVMLIRGKASRSDIREKRIMKKALVPIDGSDISERVIPYVLKIANKLKMELTILQVIPRTNHVNLIEIEARLNKLCNHLREHKITVDYKIGIGSVAENIIDFADEFAFDLVAMSTRGTNRNDLFSLGSIAQKVFLGGNTPLLLIKK
jgi:nucleotide-binding universal stress UspA family protein